MSNYIPVVDNSVFFLGLGLVFAGSVVAIMQFLFAGFTEGFSLAAAFNMRETDSKHAITFGVISSAIITFIFIAAVVVTQFMMPSTLTGVDYYELLYWAGGHVLQFTHLQLLMVAWLVLASVQGVKISLKPAQLSLLFSFNLALCLITPVPFLLYELTSFEFVDFFTQIMRHGGGVTSLVVGIFVLVGLARNGLPAREHRVSFTMLLVSFLLFGAGGVIGYMIKGSNTIIPAHYHGSIVGITLSFMGVAYLLLPKFGYVAVDRWKMAIWQPLLYGGGQLVHIIGFAWAGGYGVMRKTPGELGDGLTQAKAAMQLMRSGGLIAVIGGALFVVLVIRSVRAAKKQQQS